MTIGYVVQVNLPSGVKYMGQSGKLGLVPKFFLSAPAVRSYLARPSVGYGDQRYVPTRHSELTQVIIIREIEKGLKESKAEILGYGQFLELGPPRKQMMSNPNAVYKLQLADGTFVSFGSPRPKFGKVWNRAGDLRTHITTKSWQGKFPQKYRDAIVIEIVMGKDGIMPEKVTRYPCLDFYMASPASRQRYKADIPSTHPYKQTEYA